MPLIAIASALCTGALLLLLVPRSVAAAEVREADSDAGPAAGEVATGALSSFGSSVTKTTDSEARTSPEHVDAGRERPSFPDGQADASVAAGPSSLHASHAAVVSLANERGLICSGTLIAPNVVLTARHCLPVRTVRFGVDPRRPDAVLEVLSAMAPPVSQVDVALLVLKGRSAVAPLPIRRSRDGLRVGTFVRLVGFGAMDVGGARGMTERHFVDAPLRAYACPRADHGRFGCHPEFEMVLPRYFGNDTCAGDSGGPVLEQSRDGVRVIAVTSRAVEGAVLRCGDGGVYTRTEAIAPWIDERLRKARIE